jgi:hypothetical protein
MLMDHETRYLGTINLAMQSLPVRVLPGWR